MATIAQAGGQMDEGTSAYQLYVGIDVAADTVTAAWRTQAGQPTPPFTAEQRPAGFAALQRRLAASGVAAAEALVVMEATGNSWVALAVTLHEAGYRVAVVNPRQAHHFAKAQLRRAKTDALDARDLAQLAAARKLLHLAWALGSKQRRFDPHHRPQGQAAAPGLAA